MGCIAVAIITLGRGWDKGSRGSISREITLSQSLASKFVAGGGLFRGGQVTGFFLSVESLLDEGRLLRLRLPVLESMTMWAFPNFQVLFRI